MSNQENNQKLMVDGIVAGEEDVAASLFVPWWEWFQCTGLRVTGEVLKG
ncbi:hypothetical protein [Corynebacterium glutamicum]|nr:hypothetical protein [Corynebacterium glutamicum]